MEVRFDPDGQEIDFFPARQAHAHSSLLERNIELKPLWSYHLSCKRFCDASVELGNWRNEVLSSNGPPLSILSWQSRPDKFHCLEKTTIEYYRSGLLVMAV